MVNENDKKMYDELVAKFDEDRRRLNALREREDWERKDAGFNKEAEEAKSKLFGGTDKDGQRQGGTLKSLKDGAMNSFTDWVAGMMEIAGNARTFGTMIGNDLHLGAKTQNKIKHWIINRYDNCFAKDVDPKLSVQLFDENNKLKPTLHSAIAPDFSSQVNENTQQIFADFYNKNLTKEEEKIKFDKSGNLKRLDDKDMTPAFEKKVVDWANNHQQEFIEAFTDIVKAASADKFTHPVSIHTPVAKPVPEEVSKPEDKDAPSPTPKMVP